MRRPDAYFVLAGDGPLRKSASKLARQFDITDRVIFLGLRQDIPTIMSAADALLLTSVYEGLPNVLIEAQALGVPVITTDAGGSREAVDDGVTGFVSPNHSPHALAQLVLKVISDQKIRTEARSQGRNRMARFAPRTMIEQTVALYGLERAE